jgi:hypothetical protein
LETQDQFISILSIETQNLEKLFGIIKASNLSANLFLKHLVILADFGGEPLERVSNEFKKLFPGGTLNYFWKGRQRSYRFKALPNRLFSNKTLKIDGKTLLKKHSLDDLQKDAIVLLLFGSAYSDDNKEVASALVKCEIGEHLGKHEQLTNFIKQRYIWVRRRLAMNKLKKQVIKSHMFLTEQETSKEKLPYESFAPVVTVP